MSMYYSPEIVRALTCDRIREARGVCDDGRFFDLPRRDSALASAVRRLFARRRSPEACSC